jgi:hypothetical protein
MGVCKLCLQTKALQKSHFIPAAMYKRLLDPDVTKKDRNPVVVAPRVTATSSKQVRDYVLCVDCEGLFNKNGENWMMQQVWNGKRFPLDERLGVALPQYTVGNRRAFSGRAMGVNTAELGYFALSVTWRGAVHQWDAFGGKTTVLKLGAAEEPIRKFLLGEALFPSDVVILATVCTDRHSQKIFSLPRQTSKIPVTEFMMLALGVQLVVFTGAVIPSVLREKCCVTSTANLIFQSDCGGESLGLFSEIMNSRSIPPLKST